MPNTDYGSILLTTADKVSRTIMKKTGSQTGYKPSEWADEVNLMGLLPIRTASGTIAHFEDGADDVPLKSLTAQILPKQEGTGDPSPTNSRPISGTSVLNVTRTGKNLFDKNNVTFETGNIQSDGTIGTVAEYYHTDTYIRVKAETEYCFSGTFVDGSRRNAVAFYDVNKTFLSRYLPSNNQPAKFTTPANTYYIRFNVSTGYNVNDMQIEQGSTATTYEPYTGSTYTVALGRTVYGGSAEVVEGEGEETWGVQSIGSTTFTKEPTCQHTFRRQGLPRKYGANNYNIISSIFKTYTSGHSTGSNISSLEAGNDFTIFVNSGSNTFYIVADSSYDDKTAEEFQQDFQDISLFYEVATPTDFTFTGQEINSLEGVNNIYVDSGEVLDLEYRADIDLLLASLQGNRGLQMTRSASPVEEEQTEEDEEDEGER